MIENYYNRLKHLRIAQSYIKDVDTLLNLLDNYDHSEAIKIVSNLTIKYEYYLNKIGFYISGRTVIKGKVDELYSEQSIDSMIEDIDYLIECIIITAVVKLGIEPSIEAVVNKLID